MPTDLSDENSYAEYVDMCTKIITVKTSGWFGQCVRWLSGSVSGIRESVSCENGI